MEFGYARVSTTHQNTDRQIDALREYGISERNIIVDKQSGKDFNRLGYLALKNTMLRAGDTLVIKELDRLGRNKQMIKEERLKNHQRQSEGIQAAKNKGVKFGRPAVRKPENYEAVMQKVAIGEIKAVDAMREMGIKKTTFYKLKKLYPMEVTA